MYYLSILSYMFILKALYCLICLFCTVSSDFHLRWRDCQAPSFSCNEHLFLPPYLFFIFSLSLFLHWCPLNKFFSTIFLDSVYMHSNTIFIFLFLTYFFCQLCFYFPFLIFIFSLWYFWCSLLCFIKRLNFNNSLYIKSQHSYHNLTL